MFGIGPGDLLPMSVVVAFEMDVELRRVAEEKGVSVAQLAIAWVAAQGADIVPLVGARRRDRLAEALGAQAITLTAADLAAIEAAMPKDAASGGRYAAAMLAHMDSEKRA